MKVRIRVRDMVRVRVKCLGLATGFTVRVLTFFAKATKCLQTFRGLQ